MDLSKLRSTTPKGRPAPIRRATLPTMPTVPASPLKPEVQAAFPATGVQTVTNTPAPAYTAAAGANPQIVQRQRVNASANGTRLSDMIERMIDTAWSEQLPADYPSSVVRTLEVRRRGYVYVGVVQYVTHNAPYMADVDGAMVQGLGLARTMMDMKEGKHISVAPVPSAAPVSPAPAPTPAREPVAFNAKLAAAVEAQQDKLIAAGREYDDPMLLKDQASEKRHLCTAAVEYLLRYAPTGDDRTDAFMASVRSKLDVRPQFRVASITHRQARAVLNVWLRSRRAAA